MQRLTLPPRLPPFSPMRPVFHVFRTPLFRPCRCTSVNSRRGEILLSLDHHAGDCAVECRRVQRKRLAAEMSAGCRGTLRGTAAGTTGGTAQLVLRGGRRAAHSRTRSDSTTRRCARSSAGLGYGPIWTTLPIQISSCPRRYSTRRPFGFLISQECAYFGTTTSPGFRYSISSRSSRGDHCQ